MSKDKFGPEFQRKVIKLCCTNIKFYMEYVEILDASVFASQAFHTLFRLVRKHITGYGCEVDRDTLISLFEDYSLRQSLDQKICEEMIAEIKMVFRTHIGSEEYIKDRLISFIRKQKMMEALMEGVEVLENDGDYEAVLKKFDEAVSVGAGVGDGMSVADLMRAPEIYRELYSPEKLIATGIPGYDEALKGGFAPGEVHVIQSPPKVGKTTLGCVIGSNMIINGYTVFHVVLEVKEHDAIFKYAARMSGMTYDEMLSCPDDVYKERMQRYQNLSDKLFVKYWTNETASCLNIRSWISRIRAKNNNVSPDIIIVDYDDCLVPVGGSLSDMYENAGRIYSDMIALADYYHVPILTFAQPKREAWELAEQGELIRSHHLAHSAKKAHKTFSLSSLNFAPDSNKGTLYCDLMRRGFSSKIPMERDLSRAFVYQPDLNASQDDEDF